MENTLNKYDITWVEFRPLKGIATKSDLKKMKIGCHEPRQYNGYAYDHFPTKEKAVDYIKSLQSDIERRKISKKYEVRFFTDAQFGRTDLSKSVEGEGYPIEFTDKQNEKIIIIG